MLKLLLHKKVHFTALGSAKLITSVTNYMERAYKHMISKDRVCKMNLEQLKEGNWANNKFQNMITAEN